MGRSLPVRCFHFDFAVMFTADPKSPKMRNLAADPRVPLGVFAPLAGVASSRGAQLFGNAAILTADDDRFSYYWPAVRWQSEHADAAGPLPNPQTGRWW